MRGWTVTCCVEAAALRPDYHFVLIGPVVKINADDLPRATQHSLSRAKEVQRTSKLHGAIGISRCCRLP